MLSNRYKPISWWHWSSVIRPLAPTNADDNEIYGELKLNTVCPLQNNSKFFVTFCSALKAFSYL